MLDIIQIVVKYVYVVFFFKEMIFVYYDMVFFVLFLVIESIR